MDYTRYLAHREADLAQLRHKLTKVQAIMSVDEFNRLIELINQIQALIVELKNSGTKPPSLPHTPT